MIPEYSGTMEVVSSVEEFWQAKLQNSKLTTEWRGVPKNSCCLQQVFQGGSEESISKKEVRSLWGVPWTPEGVVQAAMRLEHPANLDSFVSDSSAKAVFRLATQGVEKICSDRIKTMKFWQERKVSVGLR
jgi:hypothetical protein